MPRGTAVAGLLCRMAGLEPATSGLCTGACNPSRFMRPCKVSRPKREIQSSKLRMLKATHEGVARIQQDPLDPRMRRGSAFARLGSNQRPPVSRCSATLSYVQSYSYRPIFLRSRNRWRRSTRRAYRCGIRPRFTAWTSPAARDARYMFRSTLLQNERAITCLLRRILRLPAWSRSRDIRLNRSALSPAELRAINCHYLRYPMTASDATAVTETLSGLRDRNLAHFR
jgi:hypothetical protein